MGSNISHQNKPFFESTEHNGTKYKSSKKVFFFKTNIAVKCDYSLTSLDSVKCWTGRNRLGSDCGMGFDPHSGQSKARLFSLSILTDKIVLVVQRCRVPTPPSTGSLVSI
jgi:hypothetical protein